MALPNTITIPLPPDLARMYDSASDEDKRKVQWLVEMLLKDLLDEPQESLQAVIEDISTKAAARGLTPELLETLLQDDE